MKSMGGRIGQIVAAAILSLIVLSVFYELRDYGPESALRKFQRATLEADDTALQLVCKQPVNSDEVLSLKLYFQRLAANGAQVRVGRVQRDIRVDTVNGVQVRVTYVVVEAIYEVRSGHTSIFWVVDHQPSGWQVNAVETVNFVPTRLGVGRTG